MIDLFKGLTNIFECSAEYFFEYMNNVEEISNNKEYYTKFKSYSDMVIYPEYKYSSIYAIKNVIENILKSAHIITNFIALSRFKLIIFAINFEFIVV